MSTVANPPQTAAFSLPVRRCRTPTRRARVRAAWDAVMDTERGWLARHPAATVALVLATVIVVPGAIEWLL